MLSNRGLSRELYEMRLRAACLLNGMKDVFIHCFPSVSGQGSPTDINASAFWVACV